MTFREMVQMGKDLIEITRKGDDYRKFYKTRPKIQFTIKSADQRIISQKEIPTKSHVKALMSMIYANHTKKTFVGVYDQNKVIRDITDTSYKTETFASNDGVGIIVGTNDTPSATVGKLTDHKLTTLIRDGVTPGRLSYSATVFSSFNNPQAGRWEFSFNRNFENLSGTDAGGGVSVTVREVGFLVNSAGTNYLGERTVTGDNPVDNDTGPPDNFHQILNVNYVERVNV